MAAGETTYTIGKVVKILSATYPDLTVSKVRYLESEGLISPTRTKSGYRTYTDKDIERLEAVLRLQSTCFYPLAVIREKLSALDTGEPLDELEAPMVDAAEEEALLSTPHVLEDIPSLINVPVAFVRTLSDAGLIQITSSPSGRQMVNGCDIPLIRASHELKRYGIDPRFLKPYLQRANREVPLFKQVLSGVIGRQGSLDDPKVRAAFDSTLDRLLDLTETVSKNLIRREIDREFGCRAASSEADR